MLKPIGLLYKSLRFSLNSKFIQKSCNPWTHFGLRPLGMGNAYVSVADDYNALFYNPAGLARLKSWDGEFFNPAIKVSKDAKSLFDDASDLGGIDDTLGVIESNAGKQVALGLSLTPHLVFKNFGFGLGIDINLLSMAFHRDLSIDVKSGAELIAPFVCSEL